jgi:RNA polymerase sigma factor (sigma-70 family)
LGVPPVTVASSLRRILAADLASESDAALLARFAAGRDEAAFAALYDRHGPMVRAACRRHCRDAHLAADAEQAVWLVLARRAAVVSRPDRLANWLFGVAVRIGRKAAAAARPRQLPVAPTSVPDASVSVLADELLRVLDEELSALPEAERLPLVLCYLEGRTQDEAARVCGTCLRTLRRRLDRGRESLRRRLKRRGVAPAAALGGLAVAPTAAPASARVLAAALAGGPVPSSLSPWVAEELAMTGTKAWWLRVALVTGLGLSGLTAAVWSATDRPAPAEPPAAAEPAALPAGAVVRLGSTGFRHPGEVKALAFAPDGKGVYAVGDGAYSGWAVPDGRSLVAVDHRDKRNSRHLTATSPDGKFSLELLNPVGRDELYAAEVTDLTTGKSVAGFGATRGEPQTGHYSLSGAFSPDGSMVAIQYIAEVALYSLPDGKLIRRISEPQSFREVVFTPDSRRLVTGSFERLSLTVWDVATGASLKTLDAGGTGTGCLALSPDGKTAVAVGTRFDHEKLPDGGELVREHRDNVLVAWDLTTGKIVHRVTADHPVQTVHVLADGTVVCVVTPAETFARSAVRRWRLSDGKALWSVAADHGAWTSAVSADGKWLATGTYTGLVVLWDIATGAPRPRTDGHAGMIESIAFDPDGKTIRTTDNSEMRTWDAATGRPTGRLAHPELVGFAQWDAAGKVVATGANVINDDRRTVGVFDAAAGRKLLTVTDPQRKKGFGFLGFGLSADGTRLAVPVTKEGVVHYELWDVPAARRLWAAPMPDDWPPGRVVFTADGRVLIGATDIITLDTATGKQTDRRDLVKDGLLPVDKSRNTHLYPSRDGRTLGFVIQNAGIFLVDSRSWKLLRTIDTPQEVHWPLTFSPDGTRFATSNAWNDSGVRVWETATGKLLGRLDGSPSRVVTIAFSPDGRRLASGGIDGTALVWDLSGLK